MYAILSFISIVCLSLSQFKEEKYIFDSHTWYPNGIHPFEETRAVKTVDTLIFCATKCAQLHGCKSFEMCPIQSENICRLLSCNSSLEKRVIIAGITCQRYHMKQQDVEKKDETTYLDNVTNVALHKPTWMSSLWSRREWFGSHFLVDGLLSLTLQYFTSTHRENSPWLKIDLEEVFLVHKVVVFNRADGWGYRLRDLIIKIGPSLTSFPFVCGTFKGPGENGQVIEILCNLCDIEGRFVLLQIEGKPGEDDALHLNEVEVFATRSS